MSLLLMKGLFFLVLLAIKEQFHIKSLQGSSLHLEASQIANSSDLKKKKINSPDSISRYRLLPIIPGNYLGGGGKLLLIQANYNTLCTIL